MNLSKSVRLFSAAVALPLALIYWPTACSGGSPLVGPHEPAAQGQSQEGQGPALPSVPKGNAPVLPHPAFAFAGPESSAASIADIAERVTPSVVSIALEREVLRQDHPFFPFPFAPPGFGGGPPQKQQGLGSGVVISADGTVLTNHHVVEQATDIKVTTADGEEYDAEVVGTDAKSDLAVIKLKGEVKNLKPLPLGDSAQLRLGDIVLAIGNPFGVGQTVTMGIVSAKGRADVGIVDYEDFIQTDAAINPGNSGGALVNMRGELVGVNTAILSRSGGYQGIGFAIPTTMVEPIMKSLVEHGRVVRGFLGIGIQDLDANLAQAFGLKDSKGVLVTDVQPGSGADKAGLQRGDVVVKVDGQVADSTGRLRNLIANKGADAKVELEILRKGKKRRVQVTLAELPDSSVASKGKPDTSGPALGMQLAPLDDRTRQQFGLGKDETGKVVVAGVKPGSRAAEAGLRPGDVILEIDKKAIGDVTAAKNALQGKKSSVLLAIRRRGAVRYLVIEP
jgi:serine protease Do